MNLLGLRRGRGLAGADGPDGLVGDHDVLEVLGGEVVQDGLRLLGDDVEVLFGLALVDVLAHAEDDLQAGLEGELRLDDELLVGLSVVLTALGVAEDGVLAAQGGEHVHGDFAGVGTLLMVRAVLGGEGDLGAFQDVGDAGEVRERRGHDEFNVGGKVFGLLHDCLGEFDAFRNCGVHLPVACNNVLSHVMWVLRCFQSANLRNPREKHNGHRFGLFIQPS